MSGFERLENLRSAKATRALLLLSIFLFSAGSGLAAGVLPSTEAINEAPTIIRAAPTIIRAAPTTAGVLFNGNEGLLKGRGPTTRLKNAIDVLHTEYSKVHTPTKAIHIAPELQFQDKDQDIFRHDVTVEEGGPLPHNPHSPHNPNKNNNCDELARLNNYPDYLACIHAAGTGSGSGS